MRKAIYILTFFAGESSVEDEKSNHHNATPTWLFKDKEHKKGVVSLVFLMKT